MRLTVLHPATSSDRALWARAARECAAIAAVFCLAVATVLLYSLITGRAHDPLITQEITVLKEKLLLQPTSEPLKQAIRDADQRLRQGYFNQKAFLSRGAYLLFTGATVFMAAIYFTNAFGKSPHLPKGTAPAEQLTRTRFALAVTGIVLLVSLTAAALFRPAPIATPVDPGTPAVPAVTLKAASTEALTKQWPAFRGLDGTGHITITDLPKSWDGPAGKHILWKTPIHLPGNNSPIVFGNRLFLAGATDKTREIYCLDTSSGAILWHKPVPFSGPVPEVSNDAGHCPATLATDGARVFAIFPSADLVAFDYNGNKLWSKSLGAPENSYGHSASLRILDNRLLIQFDQGHEEKGSKSALYAFDTATGNQLWKAPRALQSSWSTPIIFRAKSGPQIVTAGHPWVIAYDAAGAEIWKSKCLGGEVCPSPAANSSLVVVANEGADVVAIKTDGKGDVTKHHHAWTAADGLPDIVSPLATDDFVLTTTTHGLLTCFDAKTGKTVWDHDFEKTFHASPAVAGNRVYLLDTKGVMHVILLGKEFKEEATFPLGEDTAGSPAFAPGRIYIRGKSNVYCIGEK